MGSGSFFLRGFSVSVVVMRYPQRRHSRRRVMPEMVLVFRKTDIFTPHLGHLEGFTCSLSSSSICNGVYVIVSQCCPVYSMSMPHLSAYIAIKTQMSLLHSKRFSLTQNQCPRKIHAIDLIKGIVHGQGSN